MKKLKLLWLDDIRDPVKILGHVAKNIDIVWAKDYDEFEAAVKDGGFRQFDMISMDHDLGDGRNGLACMRLLTNELAVEWDPIPQIAIHSMNPVGKSNMIKALEDYILLRKRHLEGQN